MGNSKSKGKKVQKELDKFFEREKWKEQMKEESKKKNAHPSNKRFAAKQAALAVLAAPPQPLPVAAPAHLRSFDDEALDRMRYQLQHDSDAFLLNNILLSVQFFENYEKEVQDLKDNPMTEHDQFVDRAMVCRHKHVFFADKLHECVHQHVSYRRRDKLESLMTPRLFVIYDNVEASEPGDTSDYSAVLDAPFYKLRIEECREMGYAKLKKIEVLESTMAQSTNKSCTVVSDDSVYTDSEKESNDSDEYLSSNTGNALLQKIKLKLAASDKHATDFKESSYVKNGKGITDISARRGSGPIKMVSMQVSKSNIMNLKELKQKNLTLLEENDIKENHIKFTPEETIENFENKPRKSILKTGKSFNISKEYKSKVESKLTLKENNAGEDTETSGYKSNTSSRHNESSETESDYGYATITEVATPKRVELSERNNFLSSGVLPDECWTAVEVRAVDNFSDDDDTIEPEPRMSVSRNLYEKNIYLNSINFMKNFVDDYITDLGSGLGLAQDSIHSSLTQGASIYCNINKNGLKNGYEVFPALLAAWPNSANQWIIRERKIIQNPRTNFTYQWPTKYMVSKAVGFGCLLIPIGFRLKRGINPDQQLQWRVIFPAAERYLESCLAHSHQRCYLFALTLFKTFLENENSKIGIDANHIKNHLFWECEDNYAKWPEDRLGESLRLFLKSFYSHYGQSRFPNYFIDTCNEFKSIPKPLLLTLQRRLADILEAPVMHVLFALDKLKYNKRDFYPKFNCYRLYEILTTKNTLRILNPNLSMPMPAQYDSSNSEDEGDNDLNLWEKAKAHDKQYQWKKERQRQIKERRRANFYSKKQKTVEAKEKEIKKNIILPSKMDTERKRLVLEFFISHFIAMARSSEKFEAIKQAIIYLEQAHRLCVLLLEEPGGDLTANEYMEVIRDKLGDCQRKMVKLGGFMMPRRHESHAERRRSAQQPPIRKQRPRYNDIVNTDSPTDTPSAFSFVDVHFAPSSKIESNKFAETSTSEESKL